MKITYAIAMAAGRDAGNKSMVKAGRKAWNDEDFSVAAELVQKLLNA